MDTTGVQHQRIPRTPRTPPTSLVVTVQAEIERMIMNGDLNAGDRINENLLAERFGISRGPIREACRALAQEGLLTSIPNRGAFVREVDLREALDLYDIRAALDDLTGRTLAERITEPQLATLADVVARMDSEAAVGDLDRYYPLNLAFHDGLLEFAGNRRLSRLYRSLIKELHLFRRRGLLESGSMQVSNAEHRRILGALASRDPLRAGAAMRAHVLAAKQRLVGAIEAQSMSVTVAAGGERGARDQRGKRPKQAIENGPGDG